MLHELPVSIKELLLFGVGGKVEFRGSAGLDPELRLQKHLDAFLAGVGADSDDGIVALPVAVGIEPDGWLTAPDEAIWHQGNGIDPEFRQAFQDLAGAIALVNVGPLGGEINAALERQARADGGGSKSEK